MTDPTPTYPRLPLSGVPGYVPDGPVVVEFWRDLPLVWHHGDLVKRDEYVLVLDPTGAASLARAVAARVGLDVSGGVAVAGGPGWLAMDSTRRGLEWRVERGPNGFAVPALRDATDTLSALAIVARAVLT